jgi:hypothetical protein
MKKQLLYLLSICLFLFSCKSLASYKETGNWISNVSPVNAEKIEEGNIIVELGKEEMYTDFLPPSKDLFLDMTLGSEITRYERTGKVFLSEKDLPFFVRFYASSTADINHNAYTLASATTVKDEMTFLETTGSAPRRAPLKVATYTSSSGEVFTIQLCKEKEYIVESASEDYNAYDNKVWPMTAFDDMFYLKEQEIQLLDKNGTVLAVADKNSYVLYDTCTDKQAAKDAIGLFFAVRSCFEAHEQYITQDYGWSIKKGNKK